MQDMDPGFVPPPYREVLLTYHDGSVRKVYVTDREEPYPDGHLIVSRTNCDGILTHANAAFVEMSGYTREELIGQPHCILRHPDMPKAAFADLWACVQRGEQWHGYVKNLRKDGGHYWVYASVIPNVRDGVTVGYTSVRRKPSRARIAEAEAAYRDLD